MNILLVDDHAVVRRGLREMLVDIFPEAGFFEVGTAQAALEFVWKNPCDLVLLDINLPGRNGLEIIKDLKDASPRMAVLVLSFLAEDQVAVRTLKAGADGYITKESAPEELARAIQKVLEGGKYISTVLAERLAFALSGESDRLPHEALSDREFDVFRRIAVGQTVKEIAAELSLSIKTISTYRVRVLEKMNHKTNAEMTRYALQHNIV
jgi:DNA-binding NarL/FixJ family response regulator